MVVQIRCLVLLLAALALAPALRAQQVPQATPPADTAREDQGVSPRGAFLRSLVLPGWGQSAVGAPGRGGVYFALESVSLWMLYRTQQRLSEARAQQAFLLETGVLAPQEEYGLVTSREQQRQDWLVLSIFWLFFAGADAYVAAHLRNFEERVGVQPDPDGGLRIEATVPISRPR